MVAKAVKSLLVVLVVEIREKGNLEVREEKFRAVEVREEVVEVVSTVVEVVELITVHMLQEAVPVVALVT